VSGRLDWSDPLHPNGESNAAFILRCVCCVRNNLFHGGKFPTQPVPSPERDTQLLKSALDVLRGALTVHPEVNHYFKPES
jgi:hypothetical protein